MLEDIIGIAVLVLEGILLRNTYIGYGLMDCVWLTIFLAICDFNGLWMAYKIKHVPSDWRKFWGE